MYFEKDLPGAITATEIRGLDADGNSINIPLSQFLSGITDTEIVNAIILQYQKDQGIRLVNNGDSWGTEIYNSGDDTWTATGFEEPL